MDRTIEEQRELVAIKIMGWHWDYDPDGYKISLSDKDNCPEWLAEDWQPDRDLSQAMMLAEAMRKQGWNVLLALPSSGMCTCSCYEFDSKGSDYVSDLWSESDSPQQAVFAVAVQLADGMEEKSE